MSEYKVSFFRGPIEVVGYIVSPADLSHKSVAFDALATLTEVLRVETVDEIGLAIEVGGHDNSWDYWDYRVENV
jgi:hypothetical protein